eukprot:g10529.t1
MVGDRNPSAKAVGATAAGATVSVAAPVAEGIVGGKGGGGSVVRRLGRKLMAGRLRGGSNGEGGRRQYGRTFEEEHSCKQPLLVKRSDGDYTAGRPTSFCPGIGDLPGGFVGDARRSDSWQASRAAERERYDAAEARGYGLYALHAVIGQGTFGRIHLASWQHKGGVVDSAAPSTATGPPVTETSTGSLSAEGGSSSSGGGGGDGGSAGGMPFEGRIGGAEGKDARESCHTRSSSRASTSTAAIFPQDSCSSGAFGVGMGAIAPRRCRGSTISTRSLLYPAAAFGIDGNEGWAGWAGEGGGSQLRLRALKSVCKRKVTEKGLARHMETELAVLKQCSHPFIVSLSPGGQFQTSRHLHLVLNYCPGGDLFSLLTRVGRLPEQQVRVCAAQLALALRHLHSKHIAYRDLKPDNICIDARGRVILVDFSLARTGLDAAPGGKTFTFCGSAAYAAPEIISKAGHDTRVDLWSLGCVVFEALVGDHPFRRPRGEKTDRQALFQRIQRGRPDYPSSLSATARSFLKGLLSLSPDDRPGFAFPNPAPRAPSSQERSQERQPSYATTTMTAKATIATPTTVPPSDSEWPSDPVPISKPPPSLDSPSVSSSLPNRGHCGDVNGGIFRGEKGGAMGAAASRGEDNPSLLDSRTEGEGVAECGRWESVPQSGEAQQRMRNAHTLRAGSGSPSSRGPPPLLLLEHVFFRGLPGWGGPGTGGAWEEAQLEGTAVAVPALRDALDVRHFDSRFTSQAVELSLQGHPHKGGPTPAFEGFEWREDDCIEYAQVEERRTPGLFESLASALWC